MTCMYLRGRILYTPPTPENTLLGGGGRIRWGIKFLPRGASKYAAPPSSPEKKLLARNGGGAYIILAKASFSAYVLVKMLLKTGEKVHFSTKKCATNFGLPFCFFPFPFFAPKWLKYAVFALQKAKNVGRKRGLRHNFFLLVLVLCRMGTSQTTVFVAVVLCGGSKQL